jgi:Winged helix-turn helix
MSQEGRIAMSQRERDLLSIMKPVLTGQRTQAEAARLLGLGTRQVRRLQRRLEVEGDAAVVHGLRGRPSNRRKAADLREVVLAKYREHFADFGPTLASEKLAELDLVVAPETLRRWLLQAGLWQRVRQRDVHRRRRPRRRCFGELVQMDTSIHDWLEGRGESMVLVAMIDDATNRIEAAFYPGETVESYLDLTEQWLRRHGRPVALYTDRDSVFQWQSKGRATAGVTQFGRAMAELQVELILARSPQAKGRVERFFGLAQDRWVKELRLAGVTTRAAANALVRQRLVPEYNRRFTVPPASAGDAHRPRIRGQELAAVLCCQEQRVVTNDYTVRWSNRVFQLAPPALPGLRGGRVVVEQRRDGTLRLRFDTRYLNFEEITPSGRGASGAGASGTPVGLRPPGVPDAPAPDEEPRTPYRPPADHPWRRLKLK